MFGKKTNKRDWKLTDDVAYELNVRNKHGEIWVDLCNEYMRDNNIPTLDKSEHENKEYFRRIVTSGAKNYLKENRNYSVAQGLGNAMTEDLTEELTIDKIHEITRVSSTDFEPKELTTNAWGILMKTDWGQMYDKGQIKLKWKVKNYIFNEDKLVKYLGTIKPVSVKPIKQEVSPSDLVIPFFDTHFGIADIEYYEKTLQDAVNIIAEKKRRTIYIIAGQDAIHTNDNRGQTASGTFIGKIDLNKAIEGYVEFLGTITETALKYAEEVYLIYSKGNHDESISNPVARIVAERYKGNSLITDFSFDTHKVISIGNNAIGITHGHTTPSSKKGKQRLTDHYLATFPEVFNYQKNRFILSGHLHNEQVVDEAGTLVYTLSTKVPVDEWHADKAFGASRKRFTIFEFDDFDMIGARYV